MLLFCSSVFLDQSISPRRNVPFWKEGRQKNKKKSHPLSKALSWSVCICSPFEQLVATLIYSRHNTAVTQRLSGYSHVDTVPGGGGLTRAPNSSTELYEAAKGRNLALKTVHALSFIFSKLQQLPSRLSLSARTLMIQKKAVVLFGVIV